MKQVCVTVLQNNKECILTKYFKKTTPNYEQSASRKKIVQFLHERSFY